MGVLGLKLAHCNLALQISASAGFVHPYREQMYDALYMLVVHVVLCMWLLFRQAFVTWRSHRAHAVHHGRCA